MRAYRLVSLLLTGVCCLAGQLGWAQRTAVAPLAPSLPMIRLASPKEAALGEGVQIGTQSAHQPAAATVPTGRRVWTDPIYLLNSHIIINGNGLAAIRPLDIAALYVYKGATAPVQWQSLAENGIIAIKLKAGVKLKLKTKSLATIRRQAKVSGRVNFKLNGMHLENSSLRIAAKAIAGVDVLPDEGETVIDIRLVPYQSAPRHDPPGTIYIRGVASR